MTDATTRLADSIAREAERLRVPVEQAPGYICLDLLSPLTQARVRAMARTLAQHEPAFLSHPVTGLRADR